MVDTRFFPFAGPMSLGTLCGKVGIELAPDDTRAAMEITGANEPSAAKVGEIALIASRKFAESAKSSPAGVFIVATGLEGDLPAGCTILPVEAPHHVFAKMLNVLYPEIGRSLVLATVTGENVPKTEENVTIAPTAAFGPDVEIGKGTIIGPGVAVGRGVTIGRDCVIGANVSIECAYLGDRVMLWAGVRIGTEGFGWLDHGASNLKIPQLGRVIIQDQVEIGANTTVDRGALGDTVLGEGTKIDNLVQIGHNCRIGRNCLIAAMSGISGSTIVGDGVLMGGGAGTSGHLSIGAGSILHGRAAVTKDWPAGSKLAGAPAQDIKDFWRELALIRRLGKGEKT